MRQIVSLARKELRAYFVSPVALIFLATFLFVVLFAFFWVDTFFRRNVADVRPLFHWLPVLLIFLVGALTMRLWSEEQRSGTLEILMTLPVRTSRLVLGKFLAGIVLVAIALALTLGLPISVSMLGDLDWGPVMGGYVAALLLAGAYLAIGLCISSTTSNPIVALLLTVASCGLLYLFGSDLVAGFTGNRLAELLSLVGIGSRFDSIQRGVIDLRDVLYYGSLIAGFLFLNVVLLEAKRWSRGARMRPRRSAAKLSVALVIANLVVLNVAMASVRWTRLDLTERGEYSISPVTKKLLQGVEAPLLIRGYFSGKTHPLLSPLVPRIRDLIEEYGAVGGKLVRTEVVDPQQSPALEKEANEDYGIKSVPFQFQDRHEAAVVNSYFHVLVKYGDKYETLNFEDLIEIKVTGMRNIEVKLRNLEYDLTRAIKKVVYGFEPLEDVFARTAGTIEITAYVTPQSLPGNLQAVPERIQKVVRELADRSGGKLELKQVDPSGPQQDALRRELLEKHGFKPLVASLFSQDIFYLHLVISSGDRVERLMPSPDMQEADLRREITAALKRLTPGFLKTVGLVTPPPPAQPNPMMMGRQQPPQGPQFQLLQRKLGDNYEVKTVSLKDGRVAGDIDVLLVLMPTALDDKERFAIDQFLMRGGAVVISTSAYALDLSSFRGLSVKRVESKLEGMLAQWGITVSPELVLDPQNEAFPIPVERNLMGMTVREIQLLKYPFWVDVRPGGMAESNPVVAGLPSVTLQWASPLKLESRKGIDTTVLLRSSEGAWTQSDANVQPNFERFPGAGFGRDEKTETKAYPLAIVAKGVFESTFKGQPNPLLADAAGGEKKEAPPATAAQQGAGIIEKSPDGARLAIVGSAEVVSDTVLGLSRQAGSDRFTNSLQLVENLVDWAVEDVDLLSIRSRGTYARTLEPLDEAARSRWELANYALVLLALGALAGITVFKRRSVEPMQLTPAKQAKGEEGSAS